MQRRQCVCKKSGRRLHPLVVDQNTENHEVEILEAQVVMGGKKRQKCVWPDCVFWQRCRQRTMMVTTTRGQPAKAKAKDKTAGTFRWSPARPISLCFPWLSAVGSSAWMHNEPATPMILTLLQLCFLSEGRRSHIRTTQGWMSCVYMIVCIL